MIVERVIGRATAGDVEVDWVEIDWLQTVRRALRLTSRAGRRVDVLLPRGHATLRDGDVLSRGPTLAIRVRPIALLRLRPTTLDAMGRLCAELGNAHVPLEVDGESVLTPDDGPARESAARHGTACETFVGAFHPIYVQADVWRGRARVAPSV